MIKPIAHRLDIIVKGIYYHFKILIRKEMEDTDYIWVIYCLELDLVTAAKNRYQAWRDMKDVVRAHIGFAMENDNMKHCFHSAPQELWTDYFKAVSRKRKRNG
jgi:hypothetical protein